MPTYIIFDPFSTPVTNVVTQILRSWDEGKEEQLPADRVKEPDLSAVDLDKPMRWTGEVVENLTQEEIDRQSLRAVRNIWPPSNKPQRNFSYSQQCGQSSDSTWIRNDDRVDCLGNKHIARGISSSTICAHEFAGENCLPQYV